MNEAMSMDLAINNGLLIDPKSGIQGRFSVGIRGGKVVCLSALPLEAEQVIDAQGRVVAPGFIDIHMHEDRLMQDGSISIDISRYMLLQGVTTMVGGNCGLAAARAGAYLRAVDKQGLPSNYMCFSGYKLLREHLGVFDAAKRLHDDEIGAVSNLLLEGLDRGSLGLSVGLEYTTNVPIDELLVYARILAKSGRMMAVHYRYDADRCLEAIAEMIFISEATGVKLQISHIGSCSAYGSMKQSLEKIHSARARGVDVMADCYPYDAFCTYIGSAVFDPGCFERWGKSYSDLLVTEGKYRGQRCDKRIFRELREHYPSTMVVAFTMREEEVSAALADPCVMVASDGLFNAGQGHPRGAGTFPRFLGRYVRDRRVVDLVTGLSKITSMPAQRLGLQDRGTLLPGAWADVVVFDPDAILDSATFERPTDPPVGIDYVVVNGKVAAVGQEIICLNAGRALRP